MIVDHEKKFVFIHIPKTGGTSISRVLGFEARPNNPHSVEPETSKLYADYLRFCFVRNPWNRLYSSFNYALRMASEGFIKGDFVRELCRDNPDITFEAFVMDHFTEKVVRTSGHFKPQMRWIMLSSPQFIGRMEQFTTDLAFICHALEIPDFELPHDNRSTRSNYEEAYTPQMIDKVHKLYKRDVDFLGYTFERS